MAYEVLDKTGAMDPEVNWGKLNRMLSELYGRTGGAEVQSTVTIPSSAGRYNATEDGPAIFIKQVVGDTNTGNEHGVVDQTQFSRSTKAYCSFDAQPAMLGAFSYDHVVGFQSRASVQTSGVVARSVSFASMPTTASGTITALRHIEIANCTGVGAVTTQTALYIPALTKGTTNWNVYALAGRSRMGDGVGIGRDPGPARALDVQSTVSTVIRATTSAAAAAFAVYNRTTLPAAADTGLAGFAMGGLGADGDTNLNSAYFMASSSQAWVEGSAQGTYIDVYTTPNNSGTAAKRARFHETGVFEVVGDTVRISTQKTPASAAATGVKGDVCHDANYIYVCTATNTWKRAALSTW